MPGFPPRRALLWLQRLPLRPVERSDKSSGAESATITSVDLGGIESWRAEGPDALLIEGRNGSWYRARFASPCPGLAFATSIGFVTEPSGALDHFGSIVVEGERCYFRALERFDGSGATPRDL